MRLALLLVASALVAGKKTRREKKPKRPHAGRQHDPGPKDPRFAPEEERFRPKDPWKKPDEAPSPEEIKKMRNERRDKDRARGRAGHSKHSAEQHRAEDKRMHEMWCVGDRVDSITCVQHEMRMLHRSIPETSKPEDPPEDRAEKARVHREQTKAERARLHEKRQKIKAAQAGDAKDIARDEDFAMREAFCADNAETKLCSVWAKTKKARAEREAKTADAL